MYVIFIVAIALIAALFFFVDRGLKAVQRGRRRRHAAQRLVAAARRAQQDYRHEAMEREVSSALTAVLPVITTDEEDRGPRKVA
ncbi:MAG TPA: hypothetical protein VH478_24580 [Trebonia sp.]|jgi:type II secretory pathway pseudopilin PulG|nr:hypothetical protein [Trebonia sp.]